MNITRTPEAQYRWLCRQVNSLINAFGGAECVAEFLGVGARTVKKWFDCHEAQNITLPNLLAVERELVAIGLEPAVTKAHLEACGYEVRKSLQGVAKLNPAHAAMSIVPVHCDSMKEIVQAAEDGEISPKEHARITKSFEEIKRLMREYQLSYNASQHQMAAE